MSTDSVTYELVDHVGVIRLDDGKANAISSSVLTSLHECLDAAERDSARAVLIVGRDGKFSAGFDLSEMTESVDGMRALVTAGARFLIRLYGFGVPTVAACTGHAMAAGALVLLACDRRIGAEVPSKIGLNEVAIGMTLPLFAVRMATDRLATTHLSAATVTGRLYDAPTAVDAGYLDRVVPADRVEEEAMAEARSLAELRSGGVAGTKQNVRGSSIAHMLDTLEADMATLTGPVV